MIIREKVEFRSIFPDDAIEREDGHFIQLPGKNVAEALAELISGLGYEVDPVESAGDHGWDFCIKAGGKYFAYCEVTLIEDYLVQFTDPTLWYKFRKRLTPAYCDLLRRVGEALGSDPRFSEIRWVTYEECTTGRGTAGPFQE